MMSSAAMPDENIPGIVKAIPGLGPKPFAFPPESLFAFSPESRSSSPRNHRSRSPRNPFRLRPESSILPDYFDASIYGPVAAAAELPEVRFHALRHSFASMLIAQGESAKYVCDQMGHSGIQVTFDSYGHLFPQARREASAKLERAMFAQRKGRMVESLVEKAPQPPSGAAHVGRAD
jgi:hypothetical protein